MYSPCFVYDFLCNQARLFLFNNAIVNRLFQSPNGSTEIDSSRTCSIEEIENGIKFFVQFLSAGEIRW